MTNKPPPINPQQCPDPDLFFQAVTQMEQVYINVYPQESDCEACNDFRQKILEAEIPTPIVDLPGDACTQLAEKLGVEVYPTVILMRNGQIINRYAGSNEQTIEKMKRGE